MQQLITRSSKHLPNMNRCYPHSCTVCHKKKRLTCDHRTSSLGGNGERRKACPEISSHDNNISCDNFTRLVNAGNMTSSIQNHAFGTKLPIYHTSTYAARMINLQEAEDVRAVDGNGSSGINHEYVVMEYDFFPRRSGSSTAAGFEDWISLSSGSFNSSSVALLGSAAGTGQVEATITTTTNSISTTAKPADDFPIDLSLKLYYH